jgi:hypothetical protein
LETILAGCVHRQFMCRPRDFTSFQYIYCHKQQAEQDQHISTKIMRSTRRIAPARPDRVRYR